jgi:hypothetical protein
MRIAVLVVVTVLFTTGSLWLVHDEGLPGLWQSLRTDWGLQVFVDLCIALTVAWTSLRRDPRGRGVPLVPYLIATPFVGSIALLAYLIHRELRAPRT